MIQEHSNRQRFALAARPTALFNVRATQVTLVLVLPLRHGESTWGYNRTAEALANVDRGCSTCSKEINGQGKVATIRKTNEYPKVRK